MRDSRPEFITQLSFTFLLLLAITQCPFCGCRHSRDCSDIFCSGSPFVLVSATEHDRLDRETTAQEQEPNAFGSVEFVRSKTRSIDEGKIDVDLTERLHHVAVQQDAALATNLRDFAHRLN